MTKVSNSLCVCGSGKHFKKCCGRFLKGGEVAKTPEQLMRSRFSAYALGGYGEYLLSTWFPATAAGLSANELSQKVLYWKSLEVIDKSQQGEKGVVEFKAYFSKQEDEGGELEFMHEKSNFIRNRGRWYYVGGQVS